MAVIVTAGTNSNPQNAFDLIVIGGGINGVGIARDAALRGLRVVLVEQGDICHGTTRWSSRLIHGGLRYLEHFEFGLVRESLAEREILLRTAPHLVAPLPLLVPLYRGARRGRVLLSAGMLLYDLLSFDKSLPGHQMLNLSQVDKVAPGLRRHGLLGAARYFDAQVAYPERLTLENALSAESAGAVLLTYHRADKVLSAAGHVCGLRISDSAGRQRELVAPVVVNAAGPWVDQVLQGLTLEGAPFMGGTKGSHIVVNRFAGAPSMGCYVEARSDGRPFFILPWLGRLLIGTTDIRHSGDPDAAHADAQEIDYLLAETQRVFPKAGLTRAHILFHYTGVRPLPRQTGRATGAITRRHILKHHRRFARGLYSVIGGKLTTYRNLAEETVDVVLRQSRLSAAPCSTRETLLPGAVGLAEAETTLKAQDTLSAAQQSHLLAVYGARALQVSEMIDGNPKLAEEICPHTHALAAEVVFAFEYEKATGMADVLARRCMAGLAPDLGLAALESGLQVAAEQMGWDKVRCEKERQGYLAEVARLQPDSSTG